MIANGCLRCWLLQVHVGGFHPIPFVNLWPLASFGWQRIFTHSNVMKTIVVRKH